MISLAAGAGQHCTIAPSASGRFANAEVTAPKRPGALIGLLSAQAETSAKTQMRRLCEDSVQSRPGDRRRCAQSEPVVGFWKLLSCVRPHPCGFCGRPRNQLLHRLRRPWFACSLVTAQLRRSLQPGSARHPRLPQRSLRLRTRQRDGASVPDSTCGLGCRKCTFSSNLGGSHQLTAQRQEAALDLHPA